MKFFLAILLISVAFAQDATGDVNKDTSETTTTTAATTTTTTTKTTTTTTEPPTTTEEPTTVVPTPAPKPSSHNFYNISKNDVYCIMVAGEFNFMITYDIGAKKTNETTMMVPKPGSDNVKVEGSCDETTMQWMKVSWGTTTPQSSILFTFNATTNTTRWTLASLNALIVFDETFVNATKPGTQINSTFSNLMSPVDVSFNQSYKCFTELISKNGSAMSGNETYKMPFEFSMNSVQIQAFNSVPKKDNFVEASFCEADKIADIVPIAVGCALAALVLIVIVAYLVGRRRRSAAYQSV